MLAPSLSRLSALPDGVFVGSIGNAPAGALYDRIQSVLASGSEFEKDLFWDLNSVGALDVAVIYVPLRVRMLEPIHVQFGYSGGAGEGEEIMAMSNPRVLVVAEEGAEVALVEEHFGVDGGEEKCYWANPVMEIVVEDGAKVSHSYVQRQPIKAAHVKWTVARQVVVFNAHS